LGCAAFGALLVGCQSAESKRCTAEYESSQKIVLKTDASSLASVDSSIDAVQSALDACVAAKRSGEVDNLIKARAQFQAQHDALLKRAARAQHAALSPDDLARLLKNGDPNCPKGQAYEAGPDKKLVKCSGPQIVELGWDAAKKYFDSRGYSTTLTDTPPTLKAEYGSEVFTFTYSAKSDPKPPVCLSVVGAPGVPWQEVTMRASGVQPQKLERDKPIHVGDRTLTLAVGGDATQAVVSLGDCPPIH
jgi:hypothetical protein